MRYLYEKKQTAFESGVKWSKEGDVAFAILWRRSVNSFVCSIIFRYGRCDNQRVRQLYPVSSTTETQKSQMLLLQYCLPWNSIGTSSDRKLRFYLSKEYSYSKIVIVVASTLQLFLNYMHRGYTTKCQKDIHDDTCSISDLVLLKTIFFDSVGIFLISLLASFFISSTSSGEKKFSRTAYPSVWYWNEEKKNYNKSSWIISFQLR